MAPHCCRMGHKNYPRLQSLWVMLVPRPDIVAGDLPTREGQGPGGVYTLRCLQVFGGVILATVNLSQSVG